MAKFWMTLFLVSLLVSIGAVQGILFLKNAPSTIEVYKVIEVPEGASFGEATSLLHQEDLITKPLYFRLLGKWTRSEKNIKPGEYALHTAMRPMEILELLVRGKILQHPVTLPEGSTSVEIGKALEKARLLSAEAFLKIIQDPGLMNEFGIEGETMEGYLFPNTYYFAKRTPSFEIVKRMITEFQTVYNESFRKRADELGMTQREVVTLASIIEEETAAPSERALISAVFHNRLKKKMRLQSDPTVIFSLTDFNGNLTKKSLQIPSPYNTYRFKGLPPGPISNPGRESLHAALFPASVDYLYFVSRNDGTHFFSSTLRDHNNAVRKFQKRKRQVTCRSCPTKTGSS
jgi:UPF0755 protein